MRAKTPFKSKKIVREHDELYLHEDHKKNPKETFKFAVKVARPFLARCTNLSIADVGCATGDFLYYLQKSFPRAKLTGIDVMPVLVARARREVPEAQYYVGDIYTGKGLPKQKFDAVFLVGTHSIFDEAKPWVDNLLRILAPGGRAYVFGMFNPEDVDVLVRVRYAGRKNPWQSGWNMVSEPTIRDYLKQKGYSAKFYPFTIPIDLPKQKDPLRSWTFKLANGKRAIVNGTQILHTFSLLEVRKK